jgi:hypothetical protein
MAKSYLTYERNLGYIPVPEPKKEETRWTKNGKKEIKNIFNGFLYDHKIGELREHDTFKKLVLNYDEKWIRSSNPPCIAVVYYKENHEALKEFLKQNYPDARLGTSTYENGKNCLSKARIRLERKLLAAAAADTPQTTFTPQVANQKVYKV